MNASYPKPTADQVMAALQQAGRRYKAVPQSPTDIARAITEANGGSYQEPRVNRKELDRVLAELVDGGAIHCRIRHDWSGLAPSTYGFTPKGRYYALKEWVVEWEAVALEKAEKKRLETARQKAAARLTELHDSEYQELVAVYLAADTALQAP